MNHWNLEIYSISGYYQTYDIHKIGVVGVFGSSQLGKV